MIDTMGLSERNAEVPAKRLVIGLAQIDCTVGDVAGNLARVRAARRKRPPSAPIL